MKKQRDPKSKTAGNSADIGMFGEPKLGEYRA